MKQSSPFKIGFDAKRAARNNTGLGNYSRFIISLLAKYSPQNRYYLYTPSSRRTNLLNQVADHTNVCYPHTGFWRRCPSLWRIWGVTKTIAQERIDLFHGLSKRASPEYSSGEAHTKHRNHPRPDFHALSALLPFLRPDDLSL